MIKSLFLLTSFSLVVFGNTFALQAVTPPEWMLSPEGAPGTAGIVTLELEVVDCSSDPASQDRSIRLIQAPKLEIFTPETPNGTAVVICPGGGYRYLSYDHEGVVIARRLNEVGITAFVRSYRLLPGEGHASGTWAHCRMLSAP